VAQIPGADGASVKLNRNDLRRCNNPTFSPDGTNLLAKNAPQPPECDRKGGPAQCNTGGGGTNAGGTNGGGTNAGGTNGGGANAGGTNGGGTNAGGTNGGGANAGGTNGGGTNGGGTNAGTAAIDPATGAPLIDPDTGLAVNGSQQGSGSSAYAIPVAVALPDDRLRVLLEVIAVGLLLALVLGPPLLARHMRRQGGAE
jgi:hypothetical protein